MLEAVPLVFARFDWNLGQITSVFYTITLGALIGWLGDRWFQQPLYAKYYPTRKAEARLYSSMLGSFLFASGLVS